MCLGACLYICFVPWASATLGGQKGTKAPGTGVMEGSEVPYECCELNLEPPKEQPMLWLLSCLSSPKIALHVDGAGQKRGHTKDDEGQALTKTIPYVWTYVS